MKKTVIEDTMLLCMDKKYNMYLNNYDLMKIIELEDTIDALIYLLKSYGIEDEEIIDAIKNDAELKIEEVE